MQASPRPFSTKALILSAIIIVLLGRIEGFCQPLDYNPTPFFHGEWLKYKVKWGFIRLGTIEIFQEKSDKACLPAFIVRMRAKSSKLPFIKVFFVNDGTLNPENPTLQKFSIILDEKGNHVTSYNYYPASKMVKMCTVLDEAVTRRDSLFYADDLYDALGIFMMIRCLAASEFDGVLSSIIDYNVAKTHLQFSSDVDTIKVAAFDSIQTAQSFSGRADWVGQAYGGVSGPFKGWISRDDSALILRVQVKIFLGSITIDLEDFRRNPEIDWYPPASLATQ